jgi:hypothetical protein
LWRVKHLVGYAKNQKNITAARNDKGWGFCFGPEWWSDRHTSEPQISPLRFAPVETTILWEGMEGAGVISKLQIPRLRFARLGMTKGRVVASLVDLFCSG